jgi:hypothetical protein
MGRGYGMGPGAGMGPGYGMRGHGYGPSLLTPEEREAHMNAMHSLKTLDECNAYMAEHQKLVAERAKEKRPCAASTRRCLRADEGARLLG